MKLFTIVILPLIFAFVDCAKILAIFPVPGRSHFILGNTLMRALADKGHDVTVISPFEDHIPTKNGSYKNIVLTGLLEDMEEQRKTMNMFDMVGMPQLLILPWMFKIMIESTEEILAHQNVQALLHSNEHFDLVIVEQFLNDAHKSLAQFFDAPLVVLSVGGLAWEDSIVGNPSPPSYVPDLRLAYTSKMTFFQRLYNTITKGFLNLLYNLYLYPSNAALVRKYYPKPLNLYDILYNASIVLLNSHQSIYDPAPYVPNMIDIGGFHVKVPKKLPQDLQNYLDNAKNGVIYFSMGSTLYSTDMPEAKRNEFLRAFAKLKQNVLWKWEEDDLPGKPANLKTSKWFPQQDILAHPNIRLFITHGGLLSTTETTYHGVSTLAIPIYGDQSLNSQILERNKVGLVLPFNDISENVLTERLNELLTDPKFSRNAKRRSQLFRDRLVHPLDTAVYWVEHVARHRGAPHLRVTGVDLPWYQYHLLDVIAFLIIVVLINLYVTWRILKAIYKKLFGGKLQSKIKVKKQ